MATTGLPSPAVKAEECSRRSAVPDCTSPAAPPPATIASVHRRSGESSGVTAAQAITPATIAVGVATVSSRLSSHGT